MPISFLTGLTSYYLSSKEAKRNTAKILKAIRELEKEVRNTIQKTKKKIKKKGILKSDIAVSKMVPKLKEFLSAYAHLYYKILEDIELLFAKAIKSYHKLIKEAKSKPNSTGIKTKTLREVIASIDYMQSRAEIIFAAHQVQKQLLKLPKKIIYMTESSNYYMQQLKLWKERSKKVRKNVLKRLNKAEGTHS